MLTKEDYYTPEADQAYMSCSLYDMYLECEAAALAKEQGRYRPTPSRAFILGNYFHTFFESEEAHEEFCEKNAPELYTLSSLKPGKSPQKRADVEQIDLMIDVVMKDELMRRFVEMPGENEAVMTGHIFSMPWRIRMDKIVRGAHHRTTRHVQTSGKRHTIPSAAARDVRRAVWPIPEGRDLPRDYTSRNRGAYPSFLLLW